MDGVLRMNMPVDENVVDIELEPDEVKLRGSEANQEVNQLDAYLEAMNAADGLSDELLDIIGQRVVRDYEIDLKSRESWENDNKDWLKLAKLIREHKTEPWPNAASIKYPLITQAALQFASRAYPAIIQDNAIVKGRVVGHDPDGTKAARAQRIGEHMSYQYTDEIEYWEEETDAMMMILAIVGLAYRKTYRNKTEECNESEFVSAEDVVVNYWAKSNLDKVQRITHVYELSPNEVTEMENAGAFLRIAYVRPGDTEKIDNQDEDAPYTFLEQHRYWDLDNDGYKEPYVITVYKDTKKVVRITARYDEKGIIRDADGDIIKIKPVNYFTKYYFIPSADGSFYPIGFGQLLGPGNETINTTINQLLDAGTKANTGGGFIDSRVNIEGQRKSGNLTFKLGEYKKVQLDSDDIRKMIFDLPIKEPSQVLFMLLELMVKSQEKLSSVAEIFTGQQPVAGTPATTTLAAIEQGMKVFSSIYKRIHHSLKSEFIKMMRLNRLYLPDKVYFNVLDNPKSIARADYDDDDCDVVPVSNPNEVTDTMRLLTAESLTQLKGQGLNDEEITRRYLEALHVPDIDKIMAKQEDQGPSPEFQIEMKKLELEQQRIDIEKEKLELEKLKTKVEAIKGLAEAEAKEAGSQIDAYKAEVKALELELKAKGQENGSGEGQLGSVAGQPGNNGIPEPVQTVAGTEERSPGTGEIPQQEFGG